jgi:hypothetical protein
VTEVETTPDPVPPAPRRRRAAIKWSRRFFLVLAAFVAALLVSLYTIDLGPYLRTRAEQEATKYFERQVHIGELSATLRPGVFVARNVVIEGLTPDAAPFLRAEHIELHIPLTTLFRRQLIVEATMDRWALTLEMFPGNKSNIPRLRPKSSEPGRFQTNINYIQARGGSFRLMDHAQPVEFIAENVAVNFTRDLSLNKYVATIDFRGGVTNILSYEPMRLDTMSARLRFDEGNLLTVQTLDLVTDGTRSHMTGVINLNKWPEQYLDITSALDVPALKEIFFFGQDFTAAGRGEYKGRFQKFQDGKYEVTGVIRVPNFNVSGFDFPGMSGRVVWLQNRLEILGARSQFYGGELTLNYVLTSLAAGRGSLADLSTTYKGVDLTAFGRLMNWQGIELASRADGWQTMTWPSGRFADMVGDGEIRAFTADGRAVASAEPPPFVADAPLGLPFDRPIDPVPVTGVVSYRLTPSTIEIKDGWAATPETHLSFRGVTGWRDNANIPFRVVSTDWQETDRLLAAVLTAFGSKTNPIEIGGRGTFDATLTRWFSRPLITGRFAGERLRAWEVMWGSGTADVTVENSYLTVANSVIAKDNGKIVANGKYSLGFPRADGGEEIDARITADGWSLTDFKTFFELQDWPVEGTMFGDVQIYGRYRGPEGFGRLRVEPGTAWEETFESFTSRLYFERDGLRVENAEMKKSTGFVRGAGYIGWPPTPDSFSTYSFTFDGEKIPVESLVSFTVPNANLTGVLNFTMRGSGSTEFPRYEWEGRVADLFWGDEGIGQATAHMIIEEKMMTIDRLDVASDRLSVSGSGQVQRNDTYDGSFSLRFNETSVDPFLRFMAPQLSPYTQAVVSGAVRLDGQLADLSKLNVDLTLDRADLKLVDYTLSNPIGANGARVPLRMAFSKDVLTICGIVPASSSQPCAGSTGAFTLSGEGTSLTLSGTINRATSVLDVSVNGQASLAVLQGVVQDVRSSGDMTIGARVTGTFEAPVYAGNATIANGRLRHFSFPHSLDNIHGGVKFDASGIRLDGLRARMGSGARSGGGEITFAGSIGLEAFVPSTLNLTARGDGLDLRFPEGFRSIVDADLSLTGTMEAALVAGRITVRQARYTRRLQSNAGLLGFAGIGGREAPVVPSAGTLPDLPIRFDLDLVGQRLTVVDDSDATVIVSPDLKLTGTIAKPVLAGRVDIDRGETEFLGNRYTVGGFVEFTNPDRIEPYFDIEARTQIRQPDQDYRLDLTVTGTLDRFNSTINSDPPLSQTDKISLILGQNPNLDRAELRTLESPQDVQNQLMQSVVAQLLTSPISTQVGRVVERTGLVDTFTLTPLLAPDATLQQLNPGARVTVGQRISRRVYLTYSRSLDNSSLDYDILLLEYAQNEQMSWVLSRNQDGTFALDFRVRYRF